MGVDALHTLMNCGRSSAAITALRAGQSISFGDFRAAVAAWREAFTAQPGQHFALYFEDAVDFAAALLGLWHAGKTAWLPGDTRPLTLERLRLQVDGFVGDMPEGLRAAAHLQDAPWLPLNLDANQLVIFTSGSSGEPIAISKRLRQLFSEVDALEQAFGDDLGAVQILATVSHQHIYGLLFRVLWPLAAGRVMHAERLSCVEDVIPKLRAFGPAVLIASPAHLKRLPEICIDARLRAVFSSGGPLPDAAIPECIARLGQAPIEVYGSSETGGVAWRHRSGLSSGWKALPHVEWRLQTGGVLEVRSPHLDTLNWTATADRAEVADAGFCLLGRVDRVLKIEEKRVSLAALEQALLTTPWLQDLRVVTMIDASRQQLAVVVVPSDEGWALHDEIGKAAFSARLRGVLSNGLDIVTLPRRWRFVSALPSNAQGKTTQDALMALFDRRRPQARVLNVSPSSAELRIVVDAAQPQFDGHFPGHPVLPGVVQLEWAVQLGRELFPALPPHFLALEGLKFQQVISPGLTVRLTLDFKPEAGKLSFKFSSVRGVHASGRVLFGERTI